MSKEIRSPNIEKLRVIRIWKLRFMERPRNPRASVLERGGAPPLSTREWTWNSYGSWRCREWQQGRQRV